jgi:hypothetical protein
VSYSFPIINFCNPGVHYEMPCLVVNRKEEGQSITSTCLECFVLCLVDMFRLKLKAVIEQYENTCRERTYIQHDKISSD